MQWCSWRKRLLGGWKGMVEWVVKLVWPWLPAGCSLMAVDVHLPWEEFTSWVQFQVRPSIYFPPWCGQKGHVSFAMCSMHVCPVLSLLCVASAVPLPLTTNAPRSSSTAGTIAHDIRRPVPVNQTQNMVPVCAPNWPVYLIGLWSLPVWSCTSSHQVQ